jgi:hypothetical protein
MKRQCHPTLSLFVFSPQRGEAKFIRNISAFYPFYLSYTMTDFRVSNVYFTKRATNNNPRGFCSEKVLNKLAMTLDKAKRLIYILKV